MQELRPDSGKGIEREKQMKKLTALLLLLLASAAMGKTTNYIGGEIKVAAYALPGSPELARNAVSALGPRNAVTDPRRTDRLRSSTANA